MATGSQISGSPNYTLTLSDYLSQTKGAISGGLMPFFIALVDTQGDIQSLSFKSLTNEDEKDNLVYAIRLTINPASCSVNMARIVNRTLTMTGWVEEHWGEELDTITFQGSTAAFVTGGKSLYGIRNNGGYREIQDNSRTLRRSFNESLGLVDLEPVIPENDIGLTTAYRRNSVAYQELKYILQVMHTNGARFGPMAVGDQDADTLGQISSRNYIMLAHDWASYLGYIESFDVTEDAANPFRFTYTITFKSEKTMYEYQVE